MSSTTSLFVNIFFIFFFGVPEDVNLNFNNLLATVNKSPVYFVMDLKVE